MCFRCFWRFHRGGRGGRRPSEVEVEFADFDGLAASVNFSFESVTRRVTCSAKNRPVERSRLGKTTRPSAGDLTMTQMLLFDSPMDVATDATVLPVQERFQVEPVAEDRSNVAAQLEHSGGMHHMGDLARLVLLRYDLVAKRRAAMAARKAANRLAK